jgi:hypothetical protein
MKLDIRFQFHPEVCKVESFKLQLNKPPSMAGNYRRV